MSILKSYAGKQVSDVLFEIKSDYSDRKLDILSNLSFNEIINKLKPTLIDKNLLVFINPEIDNDNLKHLINSEDDVLLAFTDIDRRSKLYKAVKNNSSVEICDPLKTYKDRQTFVNRIFDEVGLPSKYKKDFLLSCGESRSRIYMEARKLFSAVKVLDNPLECLSNDLGSYTIFKFLEAMLDKDLRESLKLYSQMEHDLNIVQLNHLFSSYLLCHIYLSRGETPQAKKVWNIPDWQLSNRRSVSTQWGTKNLLKIYSHINEYLLDFADTRPPEYKIRRLIFDISAF